MFGVVRDARRLRSFAHAQTVVSATHATHTHTHAQQKNMAEQQEVIAKGEETIIALTSRDAEDVYQKLRPARDHSYEIGLKLRLSHDSVEEIYLTHKEPSQRLREVIKRALNLTSSLTWRAISDVLRNHPINLPDLANNIEATRLHRGEASISHTVVVEGRSVQPAETQQQDSTGNVNHKIIHHQDYFALFQVLLNCVQLKGLSWGQS